MMNHLPVFVQGSQIDMDHIHVFLCRSLIRGGVNTSAIPKKRKQSTNNREKILAKCIRLEKHVKFCMQNFTSYIMYREHTTKDNEKKRSSVMQYHWG